MDNKFEELEAYLRIAERPIADDGFSERVLYRLPPKRLRARTARCLSYMIAGGIGSVLTLLGVSPEFWPIESLPEMLAEYGAIVPSVLTSVAVIAVFMVPLAWLVFWEIADPGLE